jgi:hypothetical protein
MRLRLLVLLFLVAALIAALKLLPWWAGVALVVGLALTLKLAAGRLLKGILIGAFRAKSAALKGAWATLHGAARAEPPKPDADGEVDLEEGESQGPLGWVHLDMTVHVPEDNAQKTPFQLWDPHELILVPVDARPGPDFEDEQKLGRIAGVEVMENGNWVTVEGKLAGTQRVRIHAGMKAGVDTFKLRYYFEILSDRRPA